MDTEALPRDFKRTLAAIVFTDVEKFTPKAEQNEVHALGLVQRDIQLLKELCQQFQGLLFKFTGDGSLMCFESAYQALSCALEIQKALAEAAANLPPEDVLRHRIGIHLGEVFFSDTEKDVIGHGVNVAKRLEAEAEPDGICLSQTVYDVVKNCLPLQAAYAGRRELKGIKDPVPVYKIPPISQAVPAGDLADSACRLRLAGLTARIFISYRAQDPDLSLAQMFYEQLSAAGHQVFMAGQSIRLGEGWPQRIEEELERCDYFLLLLSAKSATSEMVTEEVRRVRELRERHPDSKPVILPVRLDFAMDSPLNYNLRGYLDSIQQREWRSPDDTPVIVREVLIILEGGETNEQWRIETKQSIHQTSFSLPLSDLPLPVAAPELPGGQVELASAFYVERHPIEERSCEEIKKPGSLIRIKAPTQMGKTSLMARILHYTGTQGYRAVPLNFQLADSKIFKDLDKFLQWFCANIALELDMPDRLAENWKAIFGSKVACKSYFERYLLPADKSPLALGLDEVDRVFQYPEIAADFFGLLRAWHEEAKNRDIWKKLRLIVVHSTEVYVPLDINQSPFNVGLPVELPEFTPTQVLDLAHRHGLDWQTAQVEQLMATIGGHPYLVRLALYHIARQETTLDQLLETAPTDAGLYSDHLRRHLWNLQQHPELAAAAQKVVSATEPVQLESVQGFKLHSMGLVHLQGNQVTPRCNLYCQYFRDRLK
jgi:class 3 adenylate cyclase